MKILTMLQPWASLHARGYARFAVRHDTTDYRGTIAIRASSEVDGEALARLNDDPEFAERLASLGLTSADDITALPLDAFVGVAAVADLWSFTALEEVATEDDAILLGEVGEYAVFWELVEAVEIAPIADVIVEVGAETEDNADTEAEVDDAHAMSGDGTEDDGDTEDGDEDDDGSEPDDVVALPRDPPFTTVSDELASRIRESALQAGAHFDDDDVVFWPVMPSSSLAILVGDDAVGDREITRRVWAHVLEHDLQDPEDHAYVYLDEALRSALDTNEEGMTTVEFTSLVVAQMLHAPKG